MSGVPSVEHLEGNRPVAYRLSRGGTNWGHWTCGWAA